ncbi:MAG: type II toxin-antitoxin system HipA family toxin [Rhodoferax sp.]|uniref:type II toxin-antitoxin system HipA family toxin n=1 Tax=Rhodoferax sp. TaxID=50421 RepID=UPI002639ABF2|nr:type II toxin-antitoxin system HipA family toxin [Rhodoferax sp.]MDD5333968.1 type II toxin-antitoxin system HipA family toxin [Rhodoferax sp.]
MKLNVFVSDRAVATLQSRDNFEYHLSYLDSADSRDFVSLQMPVRKASWRWPALHPFFQMNWPDDFWLSVLKDLLGPGLNVGPLNLLALVGHQFPGRVTVRNNETVETSRVAPDTRALLRGKSSQEAFLELMSRSLAGGVPGWPPKPPSPVTKALFRNASVLTERHIVKATSVHQPFMALNQHLCMRAAAATGLSASRTQVSEDGQILLTDRCDCEAETGHYKGFEDFCSLLGLPPDHRYDPSWERLARLTRDYVAPDGLRQATEQLAVTLLLSLALGNADCHAKSLAFVYRNLDDVQLAPISDMVTSLAYDLDANRAPGLHLDGQKNWNPGKGLWRYLQQHLGLENARQRELADLVCSSVSGQVPEVLHHISHTPGFANLGRRMLWQWSQGVKRLSERLTMPVPDFSVSSNESNPVAQDSPPTWLDKETSESSAVQQKKKRRSRSDLPSAADAAQLKLLFE